MILIMHEDINILHLSRMFDDAGYSWTYSGQPGVGVIHKKKNELTQAQINKLLGVRSNNVCQFPSNLVRGLNSKFDPEPTPPAAA